MSLSNRRHRNFLRTSLKYLPFLFLGKGILRTRTIHSFSTLLPKHPLQNPSHNINPTFVSDGTISSNISSQHYTSALASIQGRSRGTNLATSTRLYWKSGISHDPDSTQALFNLLRNVDIPKSSSKQRGLIFLFLNEYHASNFGDIVRLAWDSVKDRVGANSDDSEMNGNLDLTSNSLNVDLLAVMGAGVIGGGVEADERGEVGKRSKNIKPSMSVLAGTLPIGGNSVSFSVSGGNLSLGRLARDISSLNEEEEEDNNEEDKHLRNIDDATAMEKSHCKLRKTNSSRQPSYILFADPFVKISDILETLHTKTSSKSTQNPVILGGVTCPPPKISNQATLAINGRTLPRGSALILRLSKNIGFQAIVAQGCRPIGPTFTVTSASQGNVIEELDGISAIEQLEKVNREASKEDGAVITLSGLLCGILASDDKNLNDNASSINDMNSSDESSGRRMKKQSTQEDKTSRGYLIRQMIGFRPKLFGGGNGGSIVVSGQVRKGDVFRFHVCDASAAREDMGNMVQRAKTERVFGGGVAGGMGRVVAALQISCVGRGRALFGYDEVGVDLESVGELLEDGGLVSGSSSQYDEKPIAGFFANGEIGPVALAGFDSSAPISDEVNENKYQYQEDNQDSRQQEQKWGAHIHSFTTVIGLLCDFSENGIESPSLQSIETSTFGNSTDAWG